MAEVELLYFHEKTPEIGVKFIRLFGDGSGSELLIRHDDGTLNAGGGEAGDIDDFDSGDSWIPLPSNFEYFYEGQPQWPDQSTR